MSVPEAYQQFVPLPSDEDIRAAWPTPNHFLFSDPGKFFARTRVNPDYGKPGWTRDCGKRFHRGCDIAPVRITPTGKSTTVLFTDCATGNDFPSVEPTFVPHDEVYSTFEGVIAELVCNEVESEFGRHVIVRHRWPRGGEAFFSLYAHLGELDSNLQLQSNDRCSPVAISTGQRLGGMGRSSRSADARNWMAIAPHLHFEVRDAAGHNYDPVEFLQKFLRD